MLQPDLDDAGIQIFASVPLFTSAYFFFYFLIQAVRVKCREAMNMIKSGTYNYLDLHLLVQRN